MTRRPNRPGKGRSAQGVPEAPACPATADQLYGLYRQLPPGEQERFWQVLSLTELRDEHSPGHKFLGRALDQAAYLRAIADLQAELLKKRNRKPATEMVTMATEAAKLKRQGLSWLVIAERIFAGHPDWFRNITGERLTWSQRKRLADRLRHADGRLRTRPAP